MLLSLSFIFLSHLSILSFSHGGSLYHPNCFLILKHTRLIICDLYSFSPIPWTHIHLFLPPCLTPFFSSPYISFHLSSPSLLLPPPSSESLSFSSPPLHSFQYSAESIVSGLVVCPLKRSGGITPLIPLWQNKSWGRPVCVYVCEREGKRERESMSEWHYFCWRRVCLKKGERERVGYPTDGNAMEKVRERKR